ncbi:MAG TPA: hypothetical protein VER83_07920, partial [Candidatus Nanopelagicales bacterium]|nr:hypothetical protein [Candidatus Nanopelagicales bacterium]
RPEPGQEGITGLLDGKKMWIEPAGFIETHARGNEEAHRLQDPSKWVPYGVGALEGQAGRPLPVLQAGAPSGEARAAYGPGEEPRPAEGKPTATANHELL